MVVNSKGSTKTVKKVNYLRNYEKYKKANNLSKSSIHVKYSNDSQERSRIPNQWSIDAHSESSEIIMRIEEAPMSH